MTECHSPLVRPLGELSATALEIAGGKGANLGDLLRAGFPVPDGFVVTTAAYDAFVAANDLDARLATADSPDAVQALFRDADLPAEIADAVAGGYRSLGEGPVAVRSSATAEDLPDASFAGQQDTYLNLTGTHQVLDAVRRCWASLWNERAVAYRERASHDGTARLSIAVVVQRLVPAEVAGVMFTANPGNGRREQTVITAAWGLGEAVVGGQVEPDEYVVDRTAPDPIASRRIAEKKVMTVRTGTGSEQVATPAAQVRSATLTDAQVLELAALGEKVEQHFGRPQDIEWTLADGTFQLVQARPITALPEPVGDLPTEWPLPRPDSMYFRASIVEQLPDPLTPLFADLIRVAVPVGLNRLMTSLNPALAGLDIDFPTINGYVYYEYGRGSLNRMWGLTPTAVRQLTRKGFVLDRWRDHALPDYQAAVAGWVDRDPARLTASELTAGVRDLLAAGCIYYSNVQLVIPMAATTELTWTGLYNAVLRRDGDPQATDFLLGFDSTPLRAEKSLSALAAWGRGVPGLADTLDGLPAAEVLNAEPDGVDASDWNEFRSRLGSHLSEFGHTIYNLDFANPVPADDPTPVVEALRHALAGRSADPERRQRQTIERRERITAELMARLDPVRRKAARRSLSAAQHWAPIREDALAAMGLAWPMIRRLLRELGGRLTRTGAIGQPDDLFWLTAAELVAAASGLDAGAQELDDHSDAIEQRRREWRGRKLATPPQYLPVSVWMRMMDTMMPARGDQTGPVLKGTGGSGGRVTAPARVLSGPDDFAAFQPGEILVASITTPAYTPLFALASGVVTDIGGVLSHGSIVAREYGIPAVLGTGNATKRIATGDVITVDGGAGTVGLDGSDESEQPASAEPRLPAWAWIAAGTGAAVAVLAVIRRRRPLRTTRGG